jgi:hypothetical protein
LEETVTYVFHLLFVVLSAPLNVITVNRQFDELVSNIVNDLVNAIEGALGGIVQETRVAHENAVNAFKRTSG